MTYPNDIITPDIKADGGTTINESLTIDPSTHTVTLSHYARAREILSDGRVISSTIRVAKGGQQYTEVHTTPVPNGYYFYHYEDSSTDVDSSVLLFNNVDSGTVDVSYETRGDYILASRHNRIEQDLEAIEKALGVGILKQQSGILENSSGVAADMDITVNPTVQPLAGSIVVLLSSELGNTYAFTVSGTYDTVTVESVADGDKVHYLLLVSTP